MESSEMVVILDRSAFWDMEQYSADNPGDLFYILVLENMCKGIILSTYFIGEMCACKKCMHILHLISDPFIVTKPTVCIS